jgi:hydroxylamine reductase (hybrid-cluster protein)
MLAATTTSSTKTLLQNRNRTVAKSFYRQLKTEGFSHEQIIDLSATLLDLVTEDMKTRIQLS